MKQLKKNKYWINVMSCLVVVWIVGSQWDAKGQDSSIVEKIKEDLNTRVPNFELKEVEYQTWGFYWAKGEGQLLPDFRSKVRVDYDSMSNWVESRQIFGYKTEGATTLIQKIMGVGKESDFKNAIYVVSNHSEPYFGVTVQTEEYFCLDQNFKKMDHGPMHIQGILTDEIRANIESRLKNVYVLEGKYADEPGYYQFQVVFETDFVKFQKGKIVYSQDTGEWLYTRYYMSNYHVLPIDLTMYVIDNGGLENFRRVGYDMDASGESYFIEFLDRSRIRLDANFNLITSE